MFADSASSLPSNTRPAGCEASDTMARNAYSDVMESMSDLWMHKSFTQRLFCLPMTKVTPISESQKFRSLCIETPGACRNPPKVAVPEKRTDPHSDIHAEFRTSCTQHEMA